MSDLTVPSAAASPVEPEPDARPDPGSEHPAGVRKVADRFRWLFRSRLLVAVVLAVAVVLVLHDSLPSPTEVWSAVTRANWWWVAAAALSQICSVIMMAFQQRRLLQAFGVPATFGRINAITWSGNALSMSLPAGGAVSAGYTFQQFRRTGASTPIAASVLVLSGVMSTIGLVLLYLAGIGVSAFRPLWEFGEDHPVVALLVAVGIIAAVELGIRWVSRRLPQHEASTRATPRLDRWQDRHAKLGAGARHALDTLRQARVVRLQDWNIVLQTSLANWALDLACLYLSALAVGVDVHPAALAALYLGVQVVRQIPLTPGGIGVVEAALLAGLISIGAAQGPAAAAVVIYRLLSAWLLIPIGYLVLGWMRRRVPGSQTPIDEPAADDDATADHPASDHPASDLPVSDLPVSEHATPDRTAPDRPGR
ncbi:lysylphosphatidylglycerol synthase transmembrane domain-containing protein [Nakamurella leprariae]|uniref:Flippase-like domain-containing protein n=1 Tax=Nakamurella leprariae TaxID=2803911 RepID=A0A939C2A9_9ACTN|nr:lysylphosphatidylglycerol synthase transmembrane domain-containing protein [Nakamurella leprariae]MBM9468039.1 flippase-like domain-containing protein [Nakamurella leprariae]